MPALMSVQRNFYLTVAIWGPLLWSLTKGSLTNSTRNCGGIQICSSPKNGNEQVISCCMDQPSQCRWESVGSPQTSVTSSQAVNGLLISWRPDRDPFGQYNCINRLNVTEKEVIFLPESELSRCS